MRSKDVFTQCTQVTHIVHVLTSYGGGYVTSNYTPGIFTSLCGVKTKKIDGKVGLNDGHFDNGYFVHQLLVVKLSVTNPGYQAIFVIDRFQH